MSRFSCGLSKCGFYLLFLLPIFCGHSFAQASGSLHGRVTDPSGAVIPGAKISVQGNGQNVAVQSDAAGAYHVQGLAAGKYTVSAGAKGFNSFTKAVTIAAGQDQELDPALEIAVEEQQVTVQEEGTKVDVSPDNNVSAVVLKGKDLDALSDDPDELQSELQALAGPAAGPNGGQIYIDGFTGGQLPPKSSIREIRINQNPFSAQYDRLGYGRIEIFTKPGTDQYHGQFFFNDNNSIFNSRNPFVAQEPDYHSEQFEGNVGGPLSKKASFFFNVERRNINDLAAVNAQVLDPNFNFTPFTLAIANPRTRTELGPRIDYQLAQNNTLTARYHYEGAHEKNNGIGQFSLPSLGYNLNSSEHTLQVSDTQVVSAKIVNETRFEYQRSTNDQIAQNFQPETIVQGAFVSGGNPVGNNSAAQDHYELQNYTSISLSKHFVKFGGRLRTTAEAENADRNFNGTFTFNSLRAYQITEQGLQQGMTPAQIRAAGGGADQFSIIAGQPRLSNTAVDVGLYAEDDWRMRPNMTLSYGLRYETQNDIHDRADIAPRFSFAWGIDGGKNASPKTVLRLGYGIFYDRFGQNLVMQAEQLNGVNQQQFVVQSPDFYPNVPPPSSLAGAQILPTTYQISSHLKAPYSMQTAVAIERQITRIANMSVTYLNSRGVHQLFSDNINAPLPGTYNPASPGSGVRPYGNIGNLYQYQSEGIFKQNQLIANFNVRAGTMLSLFGFYTMNNIHTNTNGASSFPYNQYDLSEDFGRAPYDIHHRLFLGGTMALPYAFRISPFMVANSGQPFNITIGKDVNGDSIFNDRPAFATDLSRPSVVVTSLGAFDTRPIAGQTIIPVNYGTGPAQVTLNLRLSKSFGFGKETGGPKKSGGGGRGEHGGGPGAGGLWGGGGGGRGPFGMGNASDRRYNLTFSISARNLLNHVNQGTPVGNLSSPLFGRSNSLAGGPFSTSSANRRVDLQVMFSF